MCCWIRVNNDGNGLQGLMYEFGTGGKRDTGTDNVRIAYSRRLDKA